jgi:hypothetical protein
MHLYHTMRINFPLILHFGWFVHAVTSFSAFQLDPTKTVPSTELQQPVLYNCDRPKISRRDVFAQCISLPLISASVATVAVTTVLPPTAYAVIPTGPDDGKLVDLPPEAVRSYLQYRVPLQTSADFYLFELQPNLANVLNWGEIGELFQVNNNRGQGNPSRIEREFTNTFRILGLSMPPDTADEMREAQFKFEAAMAKVSKATMGIRRDLPVEIDKDAVPKALEGWEEGRNAINDFFRILNRTTGLAELKAIPPTGPNQYAEYGRSERRYVELKKKVKLCQNRGGPTLAVAWGQLMVSGYMQDSCGIPDLADYFYQ